MESVLMMNEKDNVAVCLKDGKAGEVVVVERKTDKSTYEITLTNDIPFAHKLALEDVKKGEIIYKYGEVIGRATVDIDKGEWVHTHNVESTRARGDQNVN